MCRRFLDACRQIPLRLSVFWQSRPEIEKAGWKFRKSAGNFNFRLTFSGVARLF
jgi:hypothetical protein